MIDNSFLKFIFLKYDTLRPFFLIMQESQIDFFVQTAWHDVTFTIEIVCVLYTNTYLSLYTYVYHWGIINYFGKSFTITMDIMW